MSINEILITVLSKIKPKKEDYERVYNIYHNIKSKIERYLIEQGIYAEVSLQGSIAKDTWLSNELDLDIFVLFEPKYPREWLHEKALKLIINALKGLNLELAYAEHPYVRVHVDNILVDVVPAFRITDPSQLKSAVDRTPFHTRYVISKLTQEGKDQVRLLKRFLKGIGVYGAEIKVQGFSGYLAELLIIKYGSFLNLLREASTWEPPIIIDIEKHYNSSQHNYLLKKFKGQPLIVIDPVDPKRNVAAALSLRNLMVFIEAARSFLSRPSLEYFFPPELNIDEYKRKISEILASRKTHVLGIVIDIPKIPPDTLWGEIKRVLKNLVRVLKSMGFSVIDYSAWSNEIDKAIILLETIEDKLPEYELHIGPPITNLEHSKRFKDKYVRKEEVIGPWMGDDGRWRVLRPRKYRTIREVIYNKSNEIFTPKHLRTCNIKVISNSQLIETFTYGIEWLKCLYEFLMKRPHWI